MTGQPSDAGDTSKVAPPPASAPYDIRHLRRSTNDRMVAGVCGGLGEYTGIDPIVFRIAFGVLAVFGGAGLLLYALGWLVVPEDTSSQSEAQRLLHGRGTPLTLFAIGIGVLGILTLTDLLRRGWPGPLPAVVIIAALVALVFHRRGWAWHTSPRTQTPSPRGGHPGAGRTGGGFFGPDSSAFSAPPTAPSASAPLGPPAGFAPSRPGGDTAASPTYMSYDPPPFAPPEPRPPRPPSLLAPIAVCMGIVVVGVLLALGASHTLDVTAQAVFAAALLTVGLSLVVGTWIGRARGLIAVGSLLAVCLVVSAFLDVPLRGGVGTRFDTPTSLADLNTAYHLAIGQENLDLSGIVTDAQTRRVDVTVGVGELHVTVPSSAKVVVHATAGTGRIRLLDTEVNGTHLSRDVTYPAATTSATAPAAAPASGEIDLDLRVGVGSVEVDRIPEGAQQ